ncbi:hypothetical protein Q4S41_17350 [Hymenobacter sp. CA1UV-4]|nr:hypothetical protein [Hymenobacter sp. CA1UV-4]
MADLEQNPALREELNFTGRAEALDTLDFHIIEQLASLPPAPGSSALQRRAELLKQQLEAIDTGLFERLRAGIHAGQYRGAAFRAMVETYVSRPPGARPQAGYDLLDVFTNGLFPLPVLPRETAAREPEMVHYQKTPARVIFELAKRAAFNHNDVFVDVGAGLGHVALLVHLLSGLPAQGIEIEPVYCALATGWATDLGLPQVTFMEADARYANYACGTVFFLYTPFRGHMLVQVLERLRTEARRRPIRLFTYGPCTLEVARQPWLHCADAAKIQADQLVEFKS